MFYRSAREMRSEFRIRGLADPGDHGGRRRVRRDPRCQQLRLLVRDRGLYHARRNQALESVFERSGHRFA